MSETTPAAIADEESLIEGDKSVNENTWGPTLISFVVFKMIPWIVYWLPTYHTFGSFVIVFIFAIADIWLCRRLFSYELVGLSWSLENPMNGRNAMVIVNCEPDPFVPSAINSNVFWSVLIGNFILWILATLSSLLRLKLIQFLALCIMDVLQAANLLLYLKCLAVSKRQSEESFRNVMASGGQVYQAQTFPDAADVPLEEIDSAEQKEEPQKEEPKEEKAEEAKEKENEEEDIC